MVPRQEWTPQQARGTAFTETINTICTCNVQHTGAEVTLLKLAVRLERERQKASKLNDDYVNDPSLPLRGDAAAISVRITTRASTTAIHSYATRPHYSYKYVLLLLYLRVRTAVPIFSIIPPGIITNYITVVQRLIRPNF